MNLVKLYLWSFLAAGLIFRLVRLGFSIRKARAGRGTTFAKPIFWVMAASYLVYILLCAHEAFRRVENFSFGVSLAGLIFFAASLLLRERAMQDLGRFFSPDIEIRREHQLIRDGLYRYLRHPLLACMGLEIVGLGLLFNAYGTLALAGFGFYFPLIWVRKTLEERALLKTMGDAYRAYMQEVGAFLPKVFLRGIHHG